MSISAHWKYWIPYALRTVNKTLSQYSDFVLGRISFNIRREIYGHIGLQVDLLTTSTRCLLFQRYVNKKQNTISKHTDCNIQYFPPPQTIESCEMLVLHRTKCLHKRIRNFTNNIIDRGMEYFSEYHEVFFFINAFLRG